VRRWAAVAGLVVLTACGGVTNPAAAYEDDAAATADSVGATVETARLAVEIAREDRAFAPYLAIVLGEAERDAAATGDHFAAIQPPDDGSDRLREEVLSMVDDGGSLLSELRIAVRRDELERLPGIAAPLRDLGDRLARFAEEHG
jgi:hypothetical protein